MRFIVSFTGRVKRETDGGFEEVPLTLGIDVAGPPIANPDKPPTPEEEAASMHKMRELAWDEFKRKSGFRRWQGDTPPSITVDENTPAEPDVAPEG